MEFPKSEKRPGLGNLVLGLAESVVVLASVTLIGTLAGLNAATVGFLFLIGVLVIASRRGIAVATATSIGATACYNFFFLPPLYTWTIADPANWIALASFLVVSLVANRLLVTAREQAAQAQRTRNELEALYNLSVDLLVATTRVGALGEAAARALSSVGASSGGLILFEGSPQVQQTVVWIGDPATEEVEDMVSGIGRHKKTVEIPSRFGRDVYLPLIVGGRIRGALVVRGSQAGRNTLESVASLVGFAVERERFIAENAHLEALKESNLLKTSLLRAVSHDLNSPLTVLTVELEAMRRRLGNNGLASEQLRNISEQAAQLQRRVENLLSLARFEAGVVKPRPEPMPPADLFRAARESLPSVTRQREIQTVVAPDTHDLLVDPSLALEIVVNLIENAHRASEIGKPIELRAGPSPTDSRNVWIEVLDRGSGFIPSPRREEGSVEVSDLGGRGLGLDIARSFAAASGGNVQWLVRPGGGTIARLELPAAPMSVSVSDL